ncbi:MAG: hypothetical protein H6811_09340 [Phycisphaeraceae bacterium]|nr:hypothetical protein [Phycisphaeraceae bacterium]
MARFIFDLEVVLRVRRLEERQRQRDVAVLERERVRLVELAERLDRAILEERRLVMSSATASLAAAGAARLDVRAIRQQASATVVLRQRVRRLAVETAGVEARLAQARRALADAAAQRRAVEILRETRFEEWRRERSRAEVRESDDGVMARLGSHGIGSKEGQDT